MDLRSSVQDINSSTAVISVLAPTLDSHRIESEQEMPGRTPREQMTVPLYLSTQGHTSLSPTVVPTQADASDPQPTPGLNRVDSDGAVMSAKKCCCASLPTWCQSVLSVFPCVKRCLDGPVAGTTRIGPKPSTQGLSERDQDATVLGDDVQHGDHGVMPMPRDVQAADQQPPSNSENSNSHVATTPGVHVTPSPMETAFQQLGREQSRRRDDYGSDTTSPPPRQRRPENSGHVVFGIERDGPLVPDIENPGKLVLSDDDNENDGGTEIGNDEEEIDSSSRSPSPWSGPRRSSRTGPS